MYICAYKCTCKYVSVFIFDTVMHKFVPLCVYVVFIQIHLDS